MGPIEEIGLLKMDFLGLRNLDVIEDAIDIIRRSRGEEVVDMERFPLDDAKTYEMLASGDSTGVFQFESEGMRDALRTGRPDRVPRPRRAWRPLPTRRDGLYPRLRQGKERSLDCPLSRTRACAGSPRRPTAASSIRSS